jgi:hypothetical protein
MSTKNEQGPWISEPESIEDFFLQVVQEISEQKDLTRKAIFELAFLHRLEKPDNLFGQLQKPSKKAKIREKLTLQQGFELAEALGQDFPSLIWEAHQRYSKK